MARYPDLYSPASPHIDTLFFSRKHASSKCSHLCTGSNIDARIAGRMPIPNTCVRKSFIGAINVRSRRRIAEIAKIHFVEKFFIIIAAAVVQIINTAPTNYNRHTGIHTIQASRFERSSSRSEREGDRGDSWRGRKIEIGGKMAI